MYAPCAPRLVVSVLSLCLMIACPRVGGGTVFVLMPDQDLVRSSTAIVLGTVQSLSTEATSRADMTTVVTITVEENIKGVSQGRVTLSVPGAASGGVRRVVFGAPHFHVGERVVVFLRQRPDGLLIPNGLAMGKYGVIHRPSGDVVRRQLGGGATWLAYDAGTRTLAARARSDEQPLADFLSVLRQMTAADPSAGGAAAVDRGEPGGSRFAAAFSFLGVPPARWIEPDYGIPVTYEVDPAGDRALGSQPSVIAALDAMAAWNDAGSSLRLLQNGFAIPAPFNACDGKSTIQFNDPWGEVGAAAGCGGVLAISGFCADESATSTLDGETFLRITEGDVTVNGTFADCRFWNATNLAEVLTHELGHTFGLGHSSENSRESEPALSDATMFFLAHFDDRGAMVRSDDSAGVRALYPGAPTPDPITLRAFALGGASNALVLNATAYFPPNDPFNPWREGVSIELRDSGGVVHRSAARVILARRRSGVPPTYAAYLATEGGSGVMSFQWIRGTTGALVLRAQGWRFALATGEQAFLILKFGDRMFVKRLLLERSADGCWVCRQGGR